jgi:hypothetical protein
MSKKIKKQNVYWDANCFLSYLQREQTYEMCEGVLKEAYSGNILIVTSVFTITEVLGGESGKPITRETQTEYENFFKSPFIKTVDVNRSLAEYSRLLIWDYRIPKKDSIHIATASMWDVPIIHTFDKKLIQFHKKIPFRGDEFSFIEIKNPPVYSEQTKLFEV